jgi:hypothetical protein
MIDEEIVKNVHARFLNKIKKKVYFSVITGPHGQKFGFCMKK